MDNEFLNAALGYAAQGLYVFPIKPRGKTPLTNHGFKDASTDPEQIRAWWTRWPDANIGITTGKASGFWVLDLDGEYPADWPPIPAPEPHVCRPPKPRTGRPPKAAKVKPASAVVGAAETAMA